MLKDEVKTVSNTPPQITKDTNPVDSLLKISFLRNYALPLIIRDPGLYDLDAFYDHPLLSCLTAGSPHYDTYESAFQQYEKETQQVYFDVRIFCLLENTLSIIMVNLILHLSSTGPHYAASFALVSTDI